ncbi:F-box domain-containing protein [Xylaria sp. FL1042]|nr:F-box domain-containing protein [Xylaria sp. FL1042]
MSPRIFSCVLCGYIICNYENLDFASWINKFRILYSSRKGIAVTGVGIYNDPDSGEWTAPLNFTARWDDAGYSFPTRDQIGVLRQPRVNGRHGFPFHEACWSLLEKAYSAETIPYKALFEVCRSLPFPSEGTGLSWGHDFGGLVSVDNQDRYPWEDRFVDRDGNSAPCLTARNNPYHVPEIQQLPYEDPQAPPAISVSGPVSTTTDCFSVLPQEIRIEIASYLPTVDALNTRRASRSFLSIFYSQQFWASRFRADSDRSWLFESHNWDKTCDWRWLYRHTNKAHRTGGMQNRERIWKLIQRVKEILRLRWTKSIALSSAIPNQTNLRWLEASGDLRPEMDIGPYRGFNEGCRLFHEQCFSIPGLPCQIAFSIIQLGDAEYIAGIRLIPSQGEAIQLGYRAEGKELILNITFLAGFNLAVGSRGIQGIQCILDNGRTSQWFGCPHEAPRTRRLAASGPITAIKAGFDGCKMVSLAVAECIPLTVETAAKAGKSLRDSAFWYPRIPGTDLYMNDDYFTARDTSITRYRPLCWTMFGGPGGIYLRYLTGISVSCWGSPCGIEFHYNTEDVPVECRKLGRYKSSEYVEVMHFPIDGPGGEIISAIEVYLRYPVSERVFWFYKQGVLISFKITTNHGRSCHFKQKMPTVKADLIKRPIMVAPASTVTGFYWSQHENSLTAIGAISEMIGEGFMATTQQPCHAIRCCPNPTPSVTPEHRTSTDTAFTQWATP